MPFRPWKYWRLKRAEVETRGQLDATTLAIPRAESAIKEVARKIEETRGKFRSEALTQLNEARTDLNKAQATGKALEDRVSRTMVTSPMRGIVNKLLVNTIGGVIQPGSDLVEIVPLDDTLLVEAKIRPQDIAFLHPGQEATVKFTAYDYTIYGGLKARLEQIGADTITDEDKKTTYYVIKLRTERSHLGTDEKPPVDHSGHGGVGGYHHRQEDRSELPAQTDHPGSRRGIARAVIRWYG